MKALHGPDRRHEFIVAGLLLLASIFGCSKTELTGRADAQIDAAPDAAADPDGDADTIEAPDYELDDGPWPAPVLRTTSSRFHTCAWRHAGPILCWGRGIFGELGSGAFASSTAAVGVLGLDEVMEVSAGGATSLGGHTCALMIDGTVSCWGSSTWGQLGDGSLGEDRAVPGPVPDLAGITAIAAGAKHVCALRDDATVFCWGFNRSGQLGDGTRTDSPTPVQVAGLEDVVEIALGSEHTCGRVRGGSVYCWGHCGYGELGNGSFTASWVPQPEKVLDLDDAVEISAAGFRSCARRASGQVVCWGNNEYGGLGDGTLVNKAEPAAVVGLTDATGLAGAHCALRADETVAWWVSSATGAGTS
jgi:alpha-tubulin suppressor-like RCC1 family protein